jgi:hypothetical protein
MIIDKKTKFRARKLDHHKFLKVIDSKDLVAEDINASNTPIQSIDNSQSVPGSPVRTVPLVSTGVDKEEEEEEHLQTALHSALVVPKSQSYVIPTPRVEELNSADWEPFYPNIQTTQQSIGKRKKPSAAVEEPLPVPINLILDGYCIEEEDNSFAQKNSISIGQLEKLFDFYEEAVSRLSVKSVPASSASEKFSDVDNSTLERIYNLWLEKKLSGHLMTNTLKHEDIDKIGTDPYVCFRRRELKIPRKTRRSDAQCVDKLRKLRYELETLGVGFDLLERRDQWRLHSWQSESELFDLYYKLDPKERAGLPAFKHVTSRKVSDKENSRRHKFKSVTTPVSAVPINNPYVKPYYPPGEVTTQMVLDIEDLLGRLKLPRSLEVTEDSHFQEYRGAKVRLRRSPPGNRIVVDRMPESISSTISSSSIFATSRGSPSSFLSLKECTQINNAFVGNFNHHYINQASGLTMPYSYLGWLALSAERNLAASTADSSNNPSTNVPTNKKTASSPKRQKTSSSSTVSSAISSSTKLNNNNITIKVKSRSSDEPSGNSSSPQRSQSSTTHFTPIGLTSNAANNKT